MKKILIVNKSFDIGGIEIAMVNMANMLCSAYEVHILSFNPEGILRNNLDQRVKVIVPCKRIQLLGTSLEGVLKNGTVVEKTQRIIYTLSAKIWDNRLCVQHALKKQRKLKGYDLAISFCHEQPKHSVTSGFCRFVEQCTEAKLKIAWIHYDASSIDLSHSFNQKYYMKMDKIVAVSESVMNAFGNTMPCLKGKLDFCYNFFDSDYILAQSKKKQEVLYPKQGIICFSACRLSKEKGIDRAIKAFEKTFKKHKDIYWYIAGDGPEKESIIELIKACGVEKQVVLIGSQVNPYPYIKNCDLYLSTSYHEAAPMVYFEAKILHVPVFSTRTLSAEELLNDGKEDIICDNTNESLEKSFFQLMDEKDKIFNAKKCLKGCKYSNFVSWKKFRKWVEE